MYLSYSTVLLNFPHIVQCLAVKFLITLRHAFIGRICDFGTPNHGGRKGRNSLALYVIIQYYHFVQLSVHCRWRATVSERESERVNSVCTRARVYRVADVTVNVPAAATGGRIYGTIILYERI